VKSPVDKLDAPKAETKRLAWLTYLALATVMTGAYFLLSGTAKNLLYVLIGL